MHYAKRNRSVEGFSELRIQKQESLKVLVCYTAKDALTMEIQTLSTTHWQTARQTVIYYFSLPYFEIRIVITIFIILCNTFTILHCYHQYGYFHM